MAGPGTRGNADVRRGRLAGFVRRWLAVGLAGCLAGCLGLAIAQTQAPLYPLKPVDRSSPRATLENFLGAGDAMAEFMASRYMRETTRANYDRVVALGLEAVQNLNLSEVPPAARQKEGRAAALALYEVLNRIALPPTDQIPDASQLEALGDAAPSRWVVPNTAIAIARAASGPQTGEFLFTPETVANAGVYHEKVRELPYLRLVPFEDMYGIVVNSGGWMLPFAWTESLPAWLRAPLADRATWKWVGLVLLVIAWALFLLISRRLSGLGSQGPPFLQALAGFVMPLAVLVATPVASYLALVQLNLTGGVGSSIQLVTTTIVFLAAAWMVWRLAPVVAEGIIASPGIPTESVDAHLIRVSARLLGIVGAVSLLALGADWLGVPVYGIVAGLGVGGIAVALAAQPTFENLIGGLSLFADKPIRVGDYCKYDNALGTVEAIGIRSTRIRGLDRTVTTIPNAALAKMPIVNLTQRDLMLFSAEIGVRYETTPEQMRYVLVKIRELLLGHARVHPDRMRARFIAFGASSLDIEVFAYLTTREWVDFLAIREDILLRIMDVIEQAGTAIAFPSQTLYFGRDHAPDETTAQASAARVQAWRDEGNLPFPDFSPTQVDRIRGSLSYPPPGSTASGASRPHMGAAVTPQPDGGEPSDAAGGPQDR